MDAETGQHNERQGIDYVDSASLEKRFHRRSGDIHEQGRGSHLWLVTFTDVMALMLTFFVLLFSMSKPVSEEWAGVSAALQIQFGQFQEAPVVRGPQDFINIEKVNFNRALNVDYLKALLEGEMKENENLQRVVLTPQKNSLIISLPQELLFASGSAAVTEEGSRALYALGGILSRIRNGIEVIGHADPRHTSGEGSGFSSNWALSFARAANAAAALEKAGYRNDIVFHGYSSGRYEDLQDIADEQARLALSRRVDIVVMDHDGSRKKIMPDFLPSLFGDSAPAR